MSLFNTLRTGASGLAVSGSTLGVIGDNIANLNTSGFKRNRMSFADMLPQSVFGLGGPAQVGRGAATSTVGVQFSQGAMMGSGSAMDVAINGAGFFQVKAGDEAFYTRDGSFGLDVDGYVVNPLGLRAQGYNAEAGQLGPVVDDLHVDQTPLAPNETSVITADLVLEADAYYQADGVTPAINTAQGVVALSGAGSLDGAATQIVDIESNYSTSITVYDSLGQPHDATVFFEQTDPAVTPNQWSYSVVIDGGETDVAGAVPGGALEIATGTLDFDTNGDLVTQTGPTASGVAWTWPGASVWTFDWEIGLDAAGVATAGSITQNAGASATISIGQDGYAMGTLSSLAVDADGQVMGQYTNGEELVLGQLAIATFDAQGGLDRAGANLYRATLASGDPALGAANTGGRGSMVGYALERSNVDLETEFVDMIQAQRSYQANAGVIRTADETLQELVNLV